MYMGERRINFDSYYDAPEYDDEPETEEEILAAQAKVEAEQKELKNAEVEWEKRDCKCKCGLPISFIDFFCDGICKVCFEQGMSELDRRD